MTNEPMDASFAVFNNHVNHASAKANAEFVRLFGQKAFDRHIGRHADGIMAILNVTPNRYVTAWVAMVTVLVNEKYAPASFKDAIKQYDDSLKALVAS